MRGRVSGRLVDDPLAQVGGDGDAVHEVAVGLDRPGDARFGAVALGRVAPQRLDRHAALARDLQSPREHRVGILDHPRHELVVGVHPQLAAHLLDDRGRLAAVIGVRVGADDQACVLEAQVAHGERAFEVRERARLLHAGVEQDEAVACRDRPGVAVRDAGPGQRQAQPEDAREHALAPAELALARHIGHAAETRLRSFGEVKEEQHGRVREAPPTRAARCRRWPRACSRRRSRANASRAAGARPRRSLAATSRRSTRATSTAPWRCGPPAAARTCAARSTRVPPRASGRSSAS